MLLQLTTTHTPATDLGFLLAKNPARCQSFGLPFGKARVFYPEATAERCTAALLVEIDPVGLVRVHGPQDSTGSGLDQYVNDRPLRMLLSHLYVLAAQGETIHLSNVVVTTPNREFNATWETLPEGKFRHSDHRFEWSRAEFQAWARSTAAAFDCQVTFHPVGPEDPQLGPPTQMGIFTLQSSVTAQPG